MDSDDVFNKISIEEIRTGDPLFFTNNTPTGLTLRTFTSTLWSHTGIAVRIKDRKGKNKHPRITMSKKGKLCVMEINARVRYDNWSRTERSGFGFSDIEYVLENQTLAAVRPLSSDIRCKLFADRTKKFVRKYGQVKFPDYFKPFLGAWLGYPMDKLSINNELFCSEMMAYYYIYTVIPVCSLQRGKKINKLPLQYILGDNCPHRPDLVAPRHFEPHNSPDSHIFKNEIYTFHRNKDNTVKALMFPAVAGAVLSILIWSSLPGNSWAEMAR